MKLGKTRCVHFVCVRFFDENLVHGGPDHLSFCVTTSLYGTVVFRRIFALVEHLFYRWVSNLMFRLAILDWSLLIYSTVGPLFTPESCLNRI